MTSLFKALSMPIAAAMLATNLFAPSIGGRHTPRFERPIVEYDGLGRKVKPKVQPRHNAVRRTLEWERYAAKVMSTHRVLPDGTFQEDPRDPKYLHSSARSFSALRRALARAA